MTVALSLASEKAFPRAFVTWPTKYHFSKEVAFRLPLLVRADKNFCSQCSLLRVSLTLFPCLFFVSIFILPENHKKYIQTYNIMTAEKLLVPADKTSNFYKMDTPSYTDLLQKNVTKIYKKVPPTIINSIEVEAKAIAKKLHLDDRINTTAKREAFITLKDHKPNFANNPTCRLINPAKSEIGKISK